MSDDHNLESSIQACFEVSAKFADFVLKSTVIIPDEHGAKTEYIFPKEHVADAKKFLDRYFSCICDAHFDNNLRNLCSSVVNTIRAYSHDWTGLVSYVLTLDERSELGMFDSCLNADDKIWNSALNSIYDSAFYESGDSDADR